ncbi:hypothetical protein RJT34_18469 [Clitoria ternatea]|uniref:Uncharacterized protein n=1 Tax=Clitoria ternatea TaxID=43366 RepID=A0AAN9JC59_CLITE
MNVEGPLTARNHWGFGTVYTTFLASNLSQPGSGLSKPEVAAAVFSPCIESFTSTPIWLIFLVFTGGFSLSALTQGSLLFGASAGDFEIYFMKIWKLLEDDQVFIIGIHGMGGVGKTFLATHMENKINRRGTFKDVLWVTVSNDFSILRLQQDIAERMGAKLYGKDERRNATNLLSAMESREKTVLILDDVWEYIDLQDVGIPVGVNGFKLILTSRLKHVCRQMDCLPTNIIEITPLENDSAWELFLLKLGHHGTPATLPHRIEVIARSIVDRCDGLPLGIIMMARAMKGINDVRRWKQALEELENGKDMEEEVLRVLKRSYDNLTGKHMQKCFLFCSLFFHDIDRTEMIMKLAENGMINGNRSLEKIFNEGHTILDKLVDHSLLMDYGGVIYMKGLVRKMACDILLNERQSYMVKCKKGLTKMPDVWEWTNDLEVVFLMHNEIEEIQEGTSPDCPRLSNLFLNSNNINNIPECFFRHMNALTALDLSNNEELIRLPNSLTTLRSLISLRLRECDSLEYVPPLGELQALSILDISGCAIEKVPEGLQSLINLKWLDLSNNKKMMLEAGVLTGLTNMQYLDLFGNPKAKIVAQDIQGMVMLECFAGHFLDCKNYNNYAQNVLRRGFGPKTFTLYCGDASWRRGFNVGDEACIVSLGDCDCEESCSLLPIDLQQLYLHHHSKWKCLCNALPSPCPSSLTDVTIVHCRNLESLFCLCGGRTCTVVQNLQSLTLTHLESLSTICKEDVVDVAFYHLKKLEICECHGLKTLLTIEVLPQLQHLEEVNVRTCRSMVEIFAVSDDNDNGSSSSIIIPKLIMLLLWDLPELKTVCKGIILCKSPPEPFMIDCDKLEKQPRIQAL